MQTKKGGFTLVEAAIVLAVIMVIGAGAIPIARNFMAIGYNSRQKADLGTIATAISQYAFEMQALPANLTILTVKNGQYGPWLTEGALTDPWDQKYNYTFDAAERRYAVWSNGPNRVNNSGGGIPSAFKNDDIGIIGH